jgi:hypothetical protein
MRNLWGDDTRTLQKNFLNKNVMSVICIDEEDPCHNSRQLHMQGKVKLFSILHQKIANQNSNHTLDIYVLCRIQHLATTSLITRGDLIRYLLDNIGMLYI